MLTRVGDEHNGRFVRETLAAEGVDVGARHDRPEAPHRARVPRHPRPRHLPARLLPRPLRRHGPARERHRRRLHRVGRALLISGTHLSQPADARRLPARHASWRAPPARASSLDIDYRPVLWGLTAPGLGEQRYVAVRRASARSCRRCCRSATWSSAPRRRSTSPAAAPTRLAALRRLRALTGGAARDEARADGLRRLRRRDPDDLERRHHRPGLSGRGVQRARRRRRLHGRLPARLAARRAAASAAAPTPTPAARSSCRATAARRRCRAGTSCSTSWRHGSAAARGCATTPSSSTCTAHRRAPRQWPDAGGARLRPPRAARGAGRRATASARERIGRRSSAARSQAERSARGKRVLPTAAARRGLPGAGMIVDDRYGDDVLPRADRQRRVDRAAGRAARLAAAARSRPATNVGLALRAWPSEHVAKCLVSYHPDDDATLRDRAAGCAADAAGGLHRHRPRAADRSDSAARAAERRRHAGARAGADLRRRHPARLVEAAAAAKAPPRGSASAPCIGRARSASAAACCCSAWRRARTRSRRASRSPRRTRSARASPSAARSSPTRPRTGSPDRLDDDAVIERGRRPLRATDRPLAQRPRRRSSPAAPRHRAPSH